MNVAESEIVRFKSGELAYLVKRFDIRPDGSHIPQEDFAQAAELSSNDGPNFKYDYSYEQIAEAMKKYVSAYAVAAEQFLKLPLFNYVVCNGDVHVKNFSIFSPDMDGIYRLTPAYDLMNTTLYRPNSPRTALDLFKDEGDFETEFFKKTGSMAPPIFWNSPGASVSWKNAHNGSFCKPEAIWKKWKR